MNRHDPLPDEALIEAVQGGDNLLCIHPLLYDLQRHSAFHRSLILCQVDYCEASVTQDSKQFVRTNLIARSAHHVCKACSGNGLILVRLVIISLAGIAH